jgi:ankyrin repeat protein
MDRCQCLTKAGIRCTRTVTKPNSHYCWQHQNCKSKIQTSPVKSKSKTKSNYDEKIDYEGRSELFRAAYAGDMEKVKRLLDEGADVNLKNKNGDMIISHVILYTLNYQLFKLLLDAGADVSGQAGHELVTKATNPKLIKDLLEARTKTELNTNQIQRDVDEGLVIARGRLDVIQLLLQNGANPNYVDEKGFTPLMSACVSGNADAIHLLFKVGLTKQTVNNVDQEGNNALIMAVSSNEIEAVTALLTDGQGQGIDINHQNKNGRTALMEAINNYEPDEIVGVLLEHNADTSLADTYGNTALILAVDNLSSHHSAELITSLADDSPPEEINHTDNNGLTALGSLCQVQTEDADAVDNLINYLILAGANPNIPDNDGVTPLMYFVMNPIFTDGYDVDSFEAMLKAGADINHKDNAGETVYDVIPEDNGWAKPLLDKYIRRKQAIPNLVNKFLISRRLAKGAQTTTGYTLHLPQKEIPEYIVRKAEYDRLCLNISSKTKASIQALARSLNIPLTFPNSTIQLHKAEICAAIKKALHF